MIDEDGEGITSPGQGGTISFALSLLLGKNSKAPHAFFHALQASSGYC